MDICDIDYVVVTRDQASITVWPHRQTDTVFASLAWPALISNTEYCVCVLKLP